MNVFISNKKEEKKIFLSPEESHHCAKVLRMKTGEIIRVIDGKGNWHEAKLISVNEKECTAEILRSEKEKNKNYTLHIAVAPTKNMDRMEWFAEKTTELGIDTISFIICKNSERKIIKADRIKKNVESAVKQSMQSWIPHIEEAVDFKKFIEREKNFSGKKFIAHCEKGDKANFHSEISSGENFLFLIGPEGDFTKEEIETAISNNFIPVSLGENRLRTETACLFIAAGLKALR